MENGLNILHIYCLYYPEVIQRQDHAAKKNGCLVKDSRLIISFTR